ncbi:hypothetical protein GGR56DRAFT_690765 [Xylariaceae sp. FL0804]|nr:hypothetical protein GGR56DRAFT_690765 [Xylariaceae sp. FL0804]
MHPRDAIAISDGDSDSDCPSNAHGDYVKVKEYLHACLEEIQATGAFATSRRHGSYVNPGLTVGDTLIPLPLVPRDAETIKSRCRQAPFGRGEETVVDTSVRNTWELDHTHFKIANPVWKAYLDVLVREAAQALGMAGVRADPYKLLLYEQGSFFHRHKDSEKAPGMIATLVICLPSLHEGGSVELSHAGKTTIIDTAKASNFSLTSLAWFSDVTHEIKPLESGYRLVLTYNIIHTGGVKASAGLAERQVGRLRSLVSQWKSVPKGPEKLVYLLEHKYTQDSLSLKHLKGRDKGVCHALQHVAAETGCVVLLAKMTRTTDDDDYGEQDMVDLDEVKTCMGETICRTLDVQDDEVLGTDPWDRDADSEDEGEFTGNEGALMTRRYHDTVVIIMPIDRLSNAISDTYGGFKPQALWNLATRTLEANPNDPIVQHNAMSLIEKTISSRKRLHFRMLSEAVILAMKFKKPELYRTALRTSLRAIEERGQVFRTIIQLVQDTFTQDPETQPDWNACLDSLTAYLGEIESRMPDGPLKVSFKEWSAMAPTRALEAKESLDVDAQAVFVELLVAKSSEPSWYDDWLVPILAKKGSKSLIYLIESTLHWSLKADSIPGAAEGIRRMLEGLSAKLTLEITNFPRESWSTQAHKYQCAEAAVLRNFVDLLDHALGLEFREQATALLDTSCTTVYQSLSQPKPKAQPKSTTNAQTNANPPPSRVVVEGFLTHLLSTLDKHGFPAPPSCRTMLAQLLREVVTAGYPSSAPSPPRGWWHAPRACAATCAVCRPLDAFLGDAMLQTHEFRLATPGRQHLERQLPRALFDCATDKTHGTPYTLVVTKRGTEFREVLERYRREVAVVERRVRPFRNRYVEELLGEDLYRELVLLQRPVSSEGEARLNPPLKREAEEEPEGSSASRPKIIE